MLYIEVILFLMPMVLIGLLFAKVTMNWTYKYGVIMGIVVLYGLYVLLGDMRWQLYPLYFAIFVLSISYLFVIRSLIVKKRVRITLGAVTTLLVLLSIALVFSFPIYQIPKPTGSYVIGTENFIIEDKKRIEEYSDDVGSFREYKVQIWYPAETVDGYEQAPWIDDGISVARALGTNNGLPFFALDHIVDVMSNSYYEAPISDAKESYPVIVLSHGWSGFRNLHTDFAEELASHGYIVVSIDHTYGSVATVLGDEVAYLNPDALPSRDETSDFIEYANQLVNTYAGDIVDTLDFLEELNSAESVSKYSERLNLSKIGLLGHSTGGGADVRVAIVDDRVSAIIGLDAWVEPIRAEHITKGLDIPSLFLRSGSWETGENNEHLYALIENSTGSSTLYQIDGTTHFDFAMVYMYSPLTKYIGFTGTVESGRLTLILKNIIVDFFNEELDYTDDTYVYPDICDEVREIRIP